MASDHHPQPAVPRREYLVLLRRLGQASPAALLAVGLALMAVIGLLDYLSGSETTLTLFYVVPIALLAWYLGWRWGAFGGLLATAIWFAANYAAGLRYSLGAVYAWNILMRLGTFEVMAYLFAQLSLALRQEQQAARTDFVTGAMNSRAFYETLPLEIARANRYHHPLTLAYLDLDNFKSVNDQLGHSTGDAVLGALVAAARGALRASDVVARVGGDEFVLLLPETGPAEAPAALARVHAAVLAAMAAHHWPVTVSLGGLVCPGPLPEAEAVVRAADHLMYAVKGAGKNALRVEELAPAERER